MDKRCIELLALLQNLPYQSIAIVSHTGAIWYGHGSRLEHLQVASLHLARLLDAVVFEAFGVVGAQRFFQCRVAFRGGPLGTVEIKSMTGSAWREREQKALLMLTQSAQSPDRMLCRCAPSMTRTWCRGILSPDPSQAFGPQGDSRNYVNCKVAMTSKNPQAFACLPPLSVWEGLWPCSGSQAHCMISSVCHHMPVRRTYPQHLACRSHVLYGFHELVEWSGLPCMIIHQGESTIYELSKKSLVNGIPYIMLRRIL